MRLWLLILILILMTGCGPSTQSGVHKQYDVEITVSGQSFANFNMGVEADTDAATESGDASASQEIDPAVALGMQGSTTSAAAKGAEQVLEEIVSRVEAWQKSQDDNRKTDSDNTTTTTENVTTPPVTPPPADGDDDSLGQDESPSVSDLVFDCEGTMSYRDCETCESVPQIICMLDTWDTCSDIPFSNFDVTWVDSSGNTRTLNVPDKCGIAMMSKEDGYGKFRYEHDKPPHKPVTYAPRGFNAIKVILKEN